MKHDFSYKVTLSGGAVCYPRNGVELDRAICDRETAVKSIEIVRWSVVQDDTGKDHEQKSG